MQDPHTKLRHQVIEIVGNIARTAQENKGQISSSFLEGAENKILELLSTYIEGVREEIVELYQIMNEQKITPANLREIRKRANFIQGFKQIFLKRAKKGNVTEAELDEITEEFYEYVQTLQ